MARRPFVSTLTTQHAYIVIVTLYIQLQFISFVCFHLGKCPQAIACWVSTILFVEYDNDNQQLYIKHRTPDRHSKTGVKWTPSLAHFEQRFINGNKGAKCYKNCSKVSILFYSILFYSNTLRPRQNCRYFTDDILKCVFANENVLISITIPLKFVLNGPIDNIPALAQKMAWRPPGDKPLSEAMMVRLPTLVRVTQPQWVNKDTIFLECKTPL